MLEIERIVSGGQTGADRAGLDWALANAVPHEGWCPAGRRAEDGEIASGYALRETAGAGYLVRTEWNVRDSDGTVIFSLAARLGGGSMRTLEFAQRAGKPVLHLSKATCGAVEDAARELVDWAGRHRVRVLNVAGPRRSGEPLVGDYVREVLDAAWRCRTAS